MEKRDARKLSTEAQQELRSLAIKLKNSGQTYAEISKAIEVHPSTICSWYKAYEKDGKKALKIKKRGRPSGSCMTLDENQSCEIQKTIQDKCPDQMKFPFALWTRKAVQALIKELYKVNMPIRTVGEYLRRWNFTSQKPLRKAYKQKVFLILDNLKVHHSYIVKDWVKEHSESIELFFLPSYSPELNPDEYLNCDLKSGVHSGTPARTKEQLNKKALSHLRKLQKLPGRVRNYFKHPKISYAG